MTRPPGRRGGGGRSPGRGKRIRIKGDKSSGCAVVAFVLISPWLVFALLAVTR